MTQAKIQTYFGNLAKTSGDQYGWHKCINLVIFPCAKGKFYILFLQNYKLSGSVIYVDNDHVLYCSTEF